MEQTLMLATTSGGTSIELVLNFFGIVVGVVALILLFDAKSQFGDRLKAGFNFIIWGVLFNILGLLWDVIFIFINTTPKHLEDIHPIFSLIGMTLFALAARKFYSTNYSPRIRESN